MIFIIRLILTIDISININVKVKFNIDVNLHLSHDVYMGVSILLGDLDVPPPNPRWLRPECEFAIGLPEMKWSPLRIRGVQGGSGRVVCDIPIGRDDTGRSAVWVLYREWLYQRKIAINP